MPAAKAAKRKQQATKSSVSKKTPQAQKRAPRQRQQKKQKSNADEKPTEAATPVDAAPPAEAATPAKAPAGKRRRTLRIKPARCGGHCILLSHLPAGLREPQLRRFLGQFGRVSRIRVPRADSATRPDGGTKGVAFVEMADTAAARIAADTLDNYLMFTRLIRCKVLQDPKRLTFASDGRRRKPKQQAGAVGDASKGAGAGADSARSNRARRLRAKVERLKRLDPEFEFPQQPSS